MKKEYKTPEMERVSMYIPNDIIFSHGKTPLILQTTDEDR